MARIEITKLYDGWRITVDGTRTYRYNHNDPDLEANAIATMLVDLKHNVRVGEES